MSPSTARSAGADQDHVGQNLRVGLLAESDRRDRTVREILERHGTEVVVLATANGNAPVEKQLDVLVVVLGVRKPIAQDGALAELLERLPRVPAVVVAPSFDRAWIEGALRLGVYGFVPTTEVERCALPALLAVSVGQIVLPASYRQGPDGPLLSAREKQVLSMVVLGFTNLEVANKLYIAETTVKSHLSSAYRKLGVGSRQEATALILSDPGLGLGILTLSGEQASG